MSTQHLANELLNLESSTKDNSQPDRAKSPTKYAIVYWIETKEFNVMPWLSRIAKDKREEAPCEQSLFYRFFGRGRFSHLKS